MNVQGASTHSGKSSSRPGMDAAAELPAASLGPGPRADIISPSQMIADAHARHGMYLTAAGTLTQFNAIMAAIHTAAFASVASGALKVALGAALALHALAAFVLCWAARPVSSAKVSPFKLADDKFGNYRRGWRMTVAAILLSAAALGVFISDNAGASVAEMLSNGTTALDAWRSAR